MYPLHIRKPNRKGFTLVELLVVILILAILMAVALPLYLGAVADSQKKTCRANMQTIANACQAYRTRSATHEYPAQLSDLVGQPDSDLQALPKCPSNAGDYLYAVDANTNQIAIACPGHGSADPTQASGSASATGGNDHGQFVPGKDSD